MRDPSGYDAVIVGAGIVGLSHAYHAHRRGLRVAIVDHADAIVGASVQNFGHICITAQSGVALDYGLAGSQDWLELSTLAGFWSAQSGTYCVARHEDELKVMSQFVATRQPSDAVLLDRAEVLDRLPVRDSSTIGGMYLPNDLQVDPRMAAPSIARWLQSVGVTFFWRTAATGFSDGVVRTSRGTLRAGITFIAVNGDVDRLLPSLSDRAELLRCRLHMVRARPRLAFPLPAPLLTGWSLLRYAGFSNLPGVGAVAQRLRTEHPDYAAIDLHQMYAPQPDGSLLIGDTHIRDTSASPFQSEYGFQILLKEAQKLFGVGEFDVIERWQGVYCSAPASEFLTEEVLPGTHVVTVTTGIGMTTAMGLAKNNLDSALAHAATWTPAGDEIHS